MANPLTIGIAVLVVAGICVNLGVAWRYRRVKAREFLDDAEAFQRDVEWQLQHELSSAIEESVSNDRETTPSSVQATSESTPLLSSSATATPTATATPSVTFANPTPPSSWHDFKAYSEVEVMKLAHGKSTRLPDDVSLFLAEEGNAALLVNPKQFNRILKRRISRQLIENYFRSRPRMAGGLVKWSGEGTGNACMRRPRGKDGRFLTLEEVEGMQNGVASVA